MLVVLSAALTFTLATTGSASARYTVDQARASLGGCVHNSTTLGSCSGTVYKHATDNIGRWLHGLEG